MGKKPVPSAAEKTSILGFLSPQKVVKRGRKGKPILQQKLEPTIINLCTSDSDVKPVKKKERLDCSPPLVVDDEENRPMEYAARLARYESPEWPDTIAEDEEADIGGNGLAGHLNPDDENEASWLEAQMEEAADADSSCDEQEDDIILVQAENAIQECTPRCPMCDRNLMKLSSMAAQKHVDNCLDVEEPAPKVAKVKFIDEVSSQFSYPVQPKSTSTTSTINAPLVQKASAFTALMSGHAEDKAWKKAAKNESIKGNRFKKGQVREAPFYKILEGMPLAVDAFRYGSIPNVKAYFLSHAHSDHYTNLSGSWTSGPIYCSKTTANLIIMNLGVRPQYVKPMQFDIPQVIEGITVTMLDANHCPGSSIFLFEGPQTSPGAPFASMPNRTSRYLHCGDFRASPRHLLHPAMLGKTIDICYLDTTYCAPSHQFPAQEQVIQACADLIKSRIDGDKNALKRGQVNASELMNSEKVFKGWLNTSKKEEDNDDTWFGKDEFDTKVKLAENECFDPKEELPRFCPPAHQSANAELEDIAKEENIQADLDDKKAVKRVSAEHFLVLVGTYSVGKERIVKAIAKAIGSKIYCTDHKLKLFQCIDEDPELRSMLTRDPLDAQVHVTGLFAITRENLGDYLDSFKGHYTKIIGLRPTGWTYKPEGANKNKIPSVATVIANQTHKNYNPAYLYPQRDSTEKLQAYGVPYSEHSSFRELTCFCVSMDHVRIIATVNVHSETSRAKMKAWFERWQAERKRRRDMGEPQMVPYRTLDYW